MHWLDAVSVEHAMSSVSGGLCSPWASYNYHHTDAHGTRQLVNGGSS